KALTVSQPKKRGSPSPSIRTPTITLCIDPCAPLPPNIVCRGSPLSRGLASAARRAAAIRRARRHHDLAKHLALLHALLRLAQVLQREHRIDHRPEHLPVQEPQALKQLMPTSHVRPEDGVLLREEEAQVDFHLAAGGGAAGHQPA